MKFEFLGRVSRAAAIGAMLLSSASCVDINETLGENFIPTDQIWDVYTPEATALEDLMLHMSDSLSGYSTTRFTFGAINDGVLGTSVKSTSFTLVPIHTELDFGEDTEVIQFHFTAARDTLSMYKDNQLKMLQNVYVSELKTALDTNVVYAGSFSQYTESGRLNREKYLDPDNLITAGIPVYNGGDSLSFDFSKEWSADFIERLKTAAMDSIDSYTKTLPGIMITTDTPVGEGGRINMFNLAMASDSYGYITGNYAELKFRARYEGSDEKVDTSFVFFFGPTEFITDESTDYPVQLALNMSDHETFGRFGTGIKATDYLYVEGGSGVKPVVKAEEIKTIVENEIAKTGREPKDVVINKATIIMPYNIGGDYEKLEKYPMILSPTVRLKNSKTGDVTFAGLTDSSIETENQGNINRSLEMYCPDISHHVQEILKLDRSAEDYKEKIENYDIWFLIMHEEITESSNSGYNDYYNNLLYNSYYNNMMYDPYGYGYGYGGYGGYGYGGYGYGGYGGYGYNNYYNYYMMAAMASSANSNTTSSSIELDRDRFYNGVLCGPEYGNTLEEKPRLKITFSVPKAEQ